MSKQKEKIKESWIGGQKSHFSLVLGITNGNCNICH